MNVVFLLHYALAIDFISAGKFSAAAYCSEEKLSEWTCGANCDGSVSKTTLSSTFNFPKTDTAGYIAVNQDLEVIVVSYRGSYSLRNWINNLKFAKLDLPMFDGIRVHSGFFKSWVVSRKVVETKLSQEIAKYPTFTVLFVGHSLGGALASLAALHFSQISDHNMVLVTFGSPRIGNEKFSRFLHPFNVFRIVNYDDIVPKLPFQRQGFHHAAQEVWIRCGSYKFCDPDNGEDPQCSDSIKLFQSKFSSHLRAWTIKFGSC